MNPGDGMSPSEAQPWCRNRRTAASNPASSVVTAPPSPVVTILRGWKERHAATPSAPHGGSSVPGPERTRRVLDQHDLLGHRGLQRLPLDRSPEEVDRHDRARARGHGGCDGRGVDEERLRIDVDEHRSRTAELDDVGGRREGVRRNDHFVARADL